LKDGDVIFSAGGIDAKEPQRDGYHFVAALVIQWALLYSAEGGAFWFRRL
jgi:hypothetical protein